MPAPVLGTWPKDCPQRRFVEGAAWWQFHRNGATAFPSERDAMEAEAVRRFGEPRAVTRLADTALRELAITDTFACQHLSVRTASALGNSFPRRILGERPTIGAVIDASDEDLLRIANIGPVAVAEVHRLRAAVMQAGAVAPACVKCCRPFGDFDVRFFDGKAGPYHARCAPLGTRAHSAAYTPAAPIQEESPAPTADIVDGAYHVEVVARLTAALSTERAARGLAVADATYSLRSENTRLADALTSAERRAEALREAASAVLQQWDDGRLLNLVPGSFDETIVEDRFRILRAALSRHPAGSDADQPARADVLTLIDQLDEAIGGRTRTTTLQTGVPMPNDRTFTDECNDARTTIKLAATAVKSLVERKRVETAMSPIEDRGEMIANLMLSYRHLEDASMRLGKAIQAHDGGVSVYDRATTVGA